MGIGCFSIFKFVIKICISNNNKTKPKHLQSLTITNDRALDSRNQALGSHPKKTKKSSITPKGTIQLSPAQWGYKITTKPSTKW